MVKYNAYERSSGVSCATFDDLPRWFKAWVSQPAPPFAFGQFMAAFLTVEEAQRVADALNAAEDNKSYFERIYMECAGFPADSHHGLIRDIAALALGKSVCRPENKSTVPEGYMGGDDGPWRVAGR